MAQRLGILRGLGRFFASHTDPTGGLVCPVHKREHTGWAAYGALVDHASWRYTREEDEAERAGASLRRAVDQLGRRPGSDAELFLPGEGVPGPAVEGAAVTDAVATLLWEAPELWPGDAATRARQAVERHVDSYLAAVATDEPDAVVRMWAATGVAAAARLTGRDDWRAAALGACARLVDELSAEGVVPVVSGTHDPSPVRQGWPLAFLLYVHEVLGHAADAPTRAALGAGLDVLVALRDGLGRKLLRNDPCAAEWGGAYEVASHPFDAFALHRGGELLGRAELSAEAGLVAEEWQAHLSALDGGVESHHGKGRAPAPANHWCRLAFSAWGVWMARVVASVPLHAVPRDEAWIDLPATGLLHVERPGYVAVLRGAGGPADDAGGCDVAGGSLQSLVFRSDPSLGRGRELLAPMARGAVPAGSWQARRGQTLGLGGSVHGAQWDAATQQQAERSEDGDRVVYRGALADASGRRLDGTVTERTYAFERAELRVADTLRLSGVTAKLSWTVPAGMTDVTVEADGAVAVRKGDRITAPVRGGEVTLTVRGRFAG